MGGMGGMGGQQRTGGGASTSPLESSLNIAYQLLKGANGMAYPGSPGVTRKRTASDAVASKAKSVRAAKVQTGRALAVKALAAPAGTLKAAAKGKAAAKRAASKAAKRKPAADASVREKPAALSTITVYRATPSERIDMIRRGIRASEAKRLFAELPIG